MSGVLQRDQFGALDTVYHWDEHTEELHVERLQDVESVIEYAASARKHGDGYNADRSLRAVAEVPLVVLEQLQREGVNYLDPNCDKELMRRLRDPALSKFRLDTQAASGGLIIVKGAR